MGPAAFGEATDFVRARFERGLRFGALCSASIRYRGVRTFELVLVVVFRGGASGSMSGIAAGSVMGLAAFGVGIMSAIERGIEIVLGTAGGVMDDLEPTARAVVNADASERRVAAGAMVPAMGTTGASPLPSGGTPSGAELAVAASGAAGCSPGLWP